MNWDKAEDVLTPMEKFIIQCKVRDVAFQVIIPSIYQTIKEKGSYDNGDYDCLGEYDIKDDYDDSIYFGGYIVELDDMSQQTYNLLEKKQQLLIDLARECGVDRFKIVKEHLTPFIVF